MTLNSTLRSIALLAAAAVAGLGATVLQSRAAEPNAKATPAASAAAEPRFSPADLEFFEKQVRPVLAENCLKCHDDKKQRGGLRLDARALILKGGDHGPSLDTTDPDKSLLLKAIGYADEDMAMPPAGKLPQDKIDILTKWVKAGAPWPAGEAVAAGAHADDPESRDPDKARGRWENQLPVRPAPPTVKDASFIKTPIDAFVLAKLEEKGLKPNGTADRVALVRRAYFDLLGLPPTPAEVDAFVNDASPDAWPKLIDRLLASPQYGEKWGRHWLDLVRYAETHGYERDNPKPYAWRYRDYVIKSFNDDKPYDQFVMEQLAGDELDVVTTETMIATGFYRLGIWDDEPANRPLARYDVLDGIVSTAGSVVLGMSIGCARCHDHKKDPISAKDYYAMLAFFQDVSDMNVKNTKVFADPASQRAADQAAKVRRDREAEIYRKIYALEQAFVATAAEKKINIGERLASDLTDLTYKFYRDTWDRLPDFAALKYEDSGALPDGIVSLAPATRNEAIGLVFEGKLKVPADGEYTFHLASSEGVRLLIDGKPVFDRPAKRKHAGDFKATLKSGLATFKLDYFNSYAKPQLSLAWSGNGFESRPLSRDATDAAVDRPIVPDSRVQPQEWTYRLDNATGGWNDVGFNPTEAWAKGPGGFGEMGTPGSFVRTEWKTKQLFVRKEFTLDQLPKGLALSLHHDEDVEVFLNGVSVYKAPRYLRDYARIELPPEALKPLKVGTNVIAAHVKQTSGGQYLDLGLLETGGAVPTGLLISRHGEAVFGAAKTIEYARLNKELDESRKTAVGQVGTEIMCVQESSRGKPTYVLIRGNPGSEGEQVQPAFPTVLVAKGQEVPALPKASVSGQSSGKRRVLAEWLTSAKNPRTARVMANRVWQYHFGRGINVSPNEFGRLGEGITHPELLDWLATELVNGGWKIKPLHKLIMTSSVYQMSTTATPASIAADPANNLYWRFNMRRLGAEEVRDSMLAVTGKLNLQQYGPSVYPPIPPEVLAGQSRPGSGWGKATPEEAARRSVYVHIKRSLLLPVLSSHDMADTDSSCPVRFTTTVPTQALGMINSKFSNEQAADLAERLQREMPGGMTDQVKLAIRLTTGRQPAAEEVKDDLAFIEQLKTKDQLPDAEALRIYCLMILNTNEFVYLD